MTGMPSVGSPAVAAFTPRDAALLIAVALMWGSSFLFIKMGLEDFSPESVAWLRIALGALALALVPASRRPLRHRRDRAGVALLGLVWMAVPFVMFTIAQQHIPSALAGMINGSAPLFTAAFAVLFFAGRLSRRLVVGLVLGFAGILGIGLPNAEGSATGTGILLVLGATMLYGIAFNLSGRLQQRNGALPVIWRAQLAALVVSAPFGVPDLAQATPSLGGVLAMLALGALGTGVAFALFAILVGRIGAPRASVATYLVPVIALGLGAGLAGESVAPVSVVGVAVVLLGAYVATSSPRRVPPTRGS